MSELLSLAKQLRAQDDDQLAQLIRRRQILNHPKDFLDLAQQLLSPKSIENCIVTLTASELGELRNLSARHLIQESESLLLMTGLVYSEQGKVRLLESAQAFAPKALPVPISSAQQQSEQAEIDYAPLAAISVFETQLAITELLLDAEQRQLRVVNRNSFGLPDIKKLASQLHKGLDFARHCYLISQRLGLLRSSDSRWWLTNAAKHWLNLEPIDRWQLMASNWLATLGLQATKELAACLSSSGSLRDALSRVFPLAEGALKDRLTSLSSEAEWLGLAVSGQPTIAIHRLLASDPSAAAAYLRTHLPHPQRKLLAQGDQTLVTPGPLPTDLEVLVRTFAELEQVSIASTYRITEQSISFGLECGLTQEKIRETLQELTGAALPQPIDYIITQAAQRFGRITISPGSGAERSLIRAKDSVLLTEILNDQRLQPYAFQPVSANSLATRFEPEVLYFGLRENGYLCVLTDSSGSVISPKQSISWRADGSPSVRDAASDLVAELRKTDAQIGENPSDDDLLRQLQLAIKNRATLKVHLQLRDGSTSVFEIRVSGLANGRLRGLDSKADAERVLPLAQITRIEF